VDAAVQQQITSSIAELESSKKALDILSAADRAKALKNVDDMIARMRTSEYAQQLRTGLVAERGENAQKFERDMSAFNATWPADSKAYVRKHLEYIMATTANVDYTLPTIWVKNPAGETVGFLSPGLDNLPWETKRAIMIGKESVDAARAAIAAWLQELGR
jgi:hypothetical protein